MNTQQAHAHIWERARQYAKGDAVLYAFRFENGRTKFGKSTNIMSRTGDHLAHGITGCTGVTIVRVNLSALDNLESLVLAYVAQRYEQHASEVFASSPSEAHDHQLIMSAIGGNAIGEPSEPLSETAAWRRQHDAEIDRQRAANPPPPRVRIRSQHPLTRAGTGMLSREQKAEYLSTIGFKPPTAPK